MIFKITVDGKKVFKNIILQTINIYVGKISIVKEFNIVWHKQSKWMQYPQLQYHNYHDSPVKQ